ncbi:MAG: hypothetical protein PUG09_11540 [Prevotella sp.]|nr:hypothetical protein [Prevotella sp.]
MTKLTYVVLVFATTLAPSFLHAKTSDEVLTLTVGQKAGQQIAGLGTEFDPHFFSQNVTRSEGCKAADWDRVIAARIKDMHLQRLRIMVQPQWYEPKNDDDNAYRIRTEGFTWDSPEMKSLYAELDLAEKEHIDVNLTLWGALAGHFLAGSNYGDWMVAPVDYEEWAENFSALIQYLTKVCGYTCIKEITPVNEPDWAYIYFGQIAKPESYVRMCRELDKRFKDDGIRDKVKFNLSDNSDGGSGTHTFLEYCCQNLRQQADIFNSHTYIFGYETPNSEIERWEATNCRLASQAGRPHFIGEFGGNQCVGASRQRDINRYERGVLLARIVLCCLNAGASGLSYWSLIDQYYGRMETYGQMQQLGLWKSVAKCYETDSAYAGLRRDYEPRPQYYAYSLLTRFIRAGQTVFPIATGKEFLAASAFRDTYGQWTYVIANADPTGHNLQLANANGGSGRYDIYCYTRNTLPNDGTQIGKSGTIRTKKNGLSIRMPAESIIVLSPVSKH